MPKRPMQEIWHLSLTSCKNAVKSFTHSEELVFLEFLPNPSVELFVAGLTK